MPLKPNDGTGTGYMLQNSAKAEIPLDSIRCIMNKSLIILSVVFLSHFTNAQNVPNSPYSYFGIGDIYNKGMGAQLMKGGTGIADRDPYGINNLNPASYSSIGMPFTFLNEFGFSLALSNRNDGDEEGTQIDLDFPYIAVAFEMDENLGASIGLRKFSNVDYGIFGESDFNGIPGQYRIRYEGAGGLNEVYFGIGQLVGERLSLGIHASYIFGSIDNTQQVNSTDIDYNVLIEDSNFLRTLSYDVGIQYMQPINNSLLTIGVTYNSKDDLLSSRDLLIAEMPSAPGFANDTLAVEALESDDYILPHSFGFGLSWNKNNKYKVSFDLQTHLWSASSLSGNDFRLRDSQRISLGFEKLPNYNAKSYLGYMRWGFGAFAERSYLVIDNEGMNNLGATIGISLPTGNRGMLRFIGEHAIRGQEINSFFTERYTKLTVNLTFLDIWFQRRRIN